MLFEQKCSKLKLIHRHTINLDRILKLVAYEIGTLDQFQHLCNFTLTPPLTREQSTDIKFGLLLGEGRGRFSDYEIDSESSFENPQSVIYI